MKHQLAISVIMAVYNCDRTVGEAIRSIIDQTCTDWELVICDDASTDGTPARLLEAVHSWPGRIRVIRNPRNRGLAFSLNRCLEIARGTYIARMDGDDVSLPERLEKQLTFLEQHPEYDLVGTAMIAFDAAGNESLMAQKPIPDRYDLLAGPCFNHATILMRKCVYEDLGGYTVLPRTMRGQDYDLWFRFFARGYRGYNLQEGLYRVREGLEDLKRRTLRRRLQVAHTALVGFRLLHFPKRYYAYAFKQVVPGLVPHRVMMAYHQWRRRVV